MAPLTEIATQIRRDVLKMVYQAQSGHPGGSLGCADFFAAMYFKILQYKLPFQMQGSNEDLFFLSNGHISPVWYSTLARAGFFNIEELNTFRKINSRLQGHPATHEHLPGIRVASGSLGQGVSVANGAAQGKKLSGDDKIVYVLTGDGELDEGQNWEAFMYAGSRKLNNLIVVIDRNGQQIDGPTETVMPLDNLKDKMKAFNFTVLEMDGNDISSIETTMEKAKKELSKNQPVAVIMHTVMGKGVSFMEGTHEWHGIAPNTDQYNQAMAELGTTSLGDF